MPIGVPRVCYYLPGDAYPQWMDIYNRLYRERLLFLASVIDPDLSNQLISIMIYLSTQEEKKRIYLYINSPGGSVIAGLALYDVMNHVKTNITTICIGLAASMASLILCNGESGHRIALSHSKIMIHQPAGGVYGQASEVHIDSLEMSRLRDQVVSLYVEQTKKSYSQVFIDMDRDKFFTPQEAKEYGLVDLVTRQAL
jgi:ATP-dependent Clp protease protease subunit